MDHCAGFAATLASTRRRGSLPAFTVKAKWVSRLLMKVGIGRLEWEWILSWKCPGCFGLYWFRIWALKPGHTVFLYLYTLSISTSIEVERKTDSRELNLGTINRNVAPLDSQNVSCRKFPILKTGRGHVADPYWHTNANYCCANHLPSWRPLDQ